MEFRNSVAMSPLQALQESEIKRAVEQVSCMHSKQLTGYDDVCELLILLFVAVGASGWLPLGSLFSSICTRVSGTWFVG
jgi:hypothetical protein